MPDVPSSPAPVSSPSLWLTVCVSVRPRRLLPPGALLSAGAPHNYPRFGCSAADPLSFKGDPRLWWAGPREVEAHRGRGVGRGSGSGSGRNARSTVSSTPSACRGPTRTSSCAASTCGTGGAARRRAPRGRAPGPRSPAGGRARIPAGPYRAPRAPCTHYAGPGPGAPAPPAPRARPPEPPAQATADGPGASE